MAKTIRLPPRWARIVRANYRAVLAVEKSSLARLRRTAEAALVTVVLAASTSKDPDQTKQAVTAAIIRGAKAMRENLASEVRASRSQARRVAVERVVVELSEASVVLGIPKPALPPSKVDPIDLAASESAAESHTSRWRAALVGALMLWSRDQSTSLVDSLKKTVQTIDYSLKRIAATEVFQAYNDEHVEISASFSAGGATRLSTEERRRRAFADRSRHRGTHEAQQPKAPQEEPRIPPGGSPYRTPGGVPGPAPAPGQPSAVLLPPTSPEIGILVRRWDGLLDGVICHRCRRMDGTFAMLGGPFPEHNIPGHMHPHCRCIDTIVPVSVKMKAFQVAREKMGSEYQPSLSDVEVVRILVDPLRKPHRKSG